MECNSKRHSPTSCRGWSLALFVLLAAGTADAQGLPGDPHRGEAMALRWCIDCHEVVPGSRKPSTVEVPDPQNPGGTTIAEAPAFQVVADDPAVTEAALRAFLQSPHASMPNFRLAPEQIDDVISYLLTLRGQRPGT